MKEKIVVYGLGEFYTSVKSFIERILYNRI